MGLGSDENQTFDDVVNTRYITKKPVNWKYPHTVGETFKSTATNYNTHDTSIYAKRRSAINTDTGEQDEIDVDAIEPFVFFEFMEVARKGNMAVNDWEVHNNKITSAFNSDQSALNTTAIDFATAIGESTGVREGDQVTYDAATKSYLEAVKDNKSMLEKVLRVYGGSVALYMPTDIQVNDQIVYNEDSRKVFGTLQAIASGDITAQSMVTQGQGAAITAATSGLATALKASGKKLFTSFGGVVGGAIGAAGAGVVQDEYQRSTGQSKNPHEYMAYQSTAMRNFSFNFTFLPDSKEESVQIKEIIKQFRLAAHALRNDGLTMTVPDHVIVSFHGAKDMIQLPPVVIESVNISYNPNNTSFFKHGNAPVEVGMALTFKEIVPIYRQDVEAGW